MSVRRAFAFAVVLATVSLTGCEWIASFGVPREIREKGLLTALEQPMPLDQPFDVAWYGEQVEHESEMRALLARMEEFADGLQDPTLRAAYVQSLKNGEPSRTQAFYDLYVNQSGDIAGSDKQFGLWERIDEGLAEGTEPELADERIIALAAFAPHGEPTTAARFTEAVRDEWNPESGNWRLPFAAIYDPADGVWSPLWEAASKKDLDNEMGDAILARLAWFETPLSNHPFAAPEQIERLARRMRESEDDDEVSRLTGQILSLDAESGEVLWKAARERPVGRSRLSAAYEYWKRTRSPEAVDYLKKVAAEEERYAIEALHCLSGMGQLEGVERPTGEKLARAKAYYSVANWCDLPDGAAEAIELTPVVSGKATVSGDEMELTVFRYSVPVSDLTPWSMGSDGLAIVDERLVLSPDEMIGIDASGSMGAAIAETSAEAEEPESSFEAGFDEAEIRSLLGPDCRTVLDLIASANPASMRGYSASADPYGSREQMLAEDERWKVFDIPIGELGLDLEDRDETEAVEPEADAPPVDAEER